MNGSRLQANDWVVVCDGRKLLLLENVGNAVSPRLRTRQVREREDAPTRELGTDAPPRAFSPASGARSALEQTDLHDQAERAFLREIVAGLNAAAAAGEVKRLLIVAPPRALGWMRKAYSESLRRALVAEIDKDLTRMPVEEIGRQLGAHPPQERG